MARAVRDAAIVASQRLPITAGVVTWWLLAIFLGIVILIGESFKIGSTNPAGVVLVFLALHIVVLALRQCGLRVRRLDLPVVAVILGFAMIGATRYQPRDVFEDLVPFLILFVVGVSLTNLDTPEHLRLCRFVIAFAAIAVLKVLAIGYLDVEPEWGGNSFWQGNRLAMPCGVNRVILKGGDAFISSSATVVLASLMLRPHMPRVFPPWTSIALVLPLLLAVLMTYTRATFGAMAGGLLIWMLLLRRTGAIDVGRAVALLVAFVAVATFMLQVGCRMGDWSPADQEEDVVSSTAARAVRSLANIGLLSAEERMAQGGDLAFAFRQLESLEALKVASQDAFLGSGLGAHYHVPLSGSRKDDGRSLYVHHLPVWLILKIGVVGAGIVYVFVGTSMVCAIRAMHAGNQPHVRGGHSRTLAALSLAGLLFLLLHDLLNNKFATASGAAAYAIFISLGTAAVSANVSWVEVRLRLRSPWTRRLSDRFGPRHAE